MIPLLRHTLLTTALAIAFTTPAFAEVCDKVRPDWDGTPATPASELLHFLTTPFTIALLCLWALAWYSGKRWAAYAVAIPMGLMLQLIAGEWASPSSVQGVAAVHVSAVQEGCIGSPVWIAMLLVPMIVILVARAHWKT